MVKSQQYIDTHRYIEVMNDEQFSGFTYPEAFLERIAKQLAADFEGIVSEETVVRYVLETHAALLRTSRVKSALAVRTERFVKDRLTALAQAKGALKKEKPEILFVCVHNAGRSQMAAVLAEHLSLGRVNVRSAGSMPSSDISVEVQAAMQELGLDLAREFPKPLTDDVVQAADYVITMGCGDACPIYPGKTYLDWELNDPAGQSLDDVRGIRDQVEARVKDLLTEIGVL